MANVKIRFSIEVDGNVMVDHVIEQEKRATFNRERELAEEVVNKMNTFYTSHSIYHQDWCDLTEMKKRYQELKEEC